MLLSQALCVGMIAQALGQCARTRNRPPRYQAGQYSLISDEQAIFTKLIDFASRISIRRR